MNEFVHSKYRFAPDSSPTYKRYFRLAVEHTSPLAGAIQAEKNIIEWLNNKDNEEHQTEVRSHPRTIDLEPE